MNLINQLQSSSPIIYEEDFVKKIAIGVLALIWISCFALFAGSNEMGLWNAVKNENLEQVIYYLKQGAECDALDKLGATPLHWAAMVGNHKIVLELLQKGANPQASGERLSKPLILAAISGSCKCVKNLLEYDNDVSGPNQKGDTALHAAIKSKHIHIVRILLKAGADPKYANLDGVTPLQRAQATRNEELIALVTAYVQKSDCS